MSIDPKLNVIPSPSPKSQSGQVRIVKILLMGWWKILLLWVVLVPIILAVVAYKKPEFTSEAKLYVNKPRRAETASDRMVGMELPEQWRVTDIQTEINLIKADNLTTRVFTKLGLNTAIEGDQESFGHLPWYWEWLLSQRDPRSYLQVLAVTESRTNPDIYAPVVYTVRFNDSQSFTVISPSGVFSSGQLGKPVQTQEASFILSSQGGGQTKQGAEFRITVSPVGLFLDEIGRRLSVTTKKRVIGLENNLIEISYRGVSPYISQLFVNMLLDEYMDQNKEWARESALSRLNFIQAQQKQVSDEAQKSVDAIGHFEKSETKEKSFTEQTRSSEVFSNLSAFLVLEEQKAKIALASLSDEVRVINRPSLPLKESAPMLVPTLLGTVFFAFLLACMVIAIPVLRIHYFTSLEEIKAAHFNPVFVNIPYRPHKNGRAAPETVEQNPQSRFGESIRLLRANLLNMAGKKNQIVLITSPMPGDGKSTVTSNLATVLANSEYVENVLLVDADMYRPSMHTIFGLNPSQGLSGFLNGSKGLKEIIQSYPMNNGKKLSVICAGSIPPSPVELVATKAMQELLEYGRQHYSFVLVDSPPYPMSPVSAILAKSMDRVLAVARLEYTDRDIFNQCVTDLEKKNENVGMVIIMGKGEEKGYGYGSYGAAYGYGKGA